MKYTVEDLSQVKKHVEVSVPVKEVDAKINLMIKDLGRDLKLPGFRPGKVPASIVESRFSGQIYREATSHLVNEKAAEIVKELKVTPISAIDYDGPEKVERGKNFDFKFDFEIIPEFEMPDYEGLPVDEEIEEFDEAKIDETIERIRLNMAELNPLEVNRPANDGEVAFVDFTATDEQGNAVEGFRGKGYQLLIGQGHIQEDFEEIIKKLAPGETGEGPVKMNEHTADPKLASQTINVKATVVSLAERILPEINDAFAARLGAGTVEEMRESIKKAHIENTKRAAKEISQDKLLKEVLSKLEYELPETVVTSRLNSLMSEFRASMKRLGKEDPKDWDESEENVEKELRQEAEKFVKSEMFLLRVAEKEKIQVSTQEIDHYLYDLAHRSGLDPKQLREYYYQNDLIYSLQDRIKTEKALALIYDKAKVNEISVKPGKEKKAADSAKKAKTSKAAAKPKAEKK